MGCSAPLEVAFSKKVGQEGLYLFLCLLPTSRPLSLAVGVKLLEILAEHVHMSSGSFINIRWGWYRAGEAGGLSGEVAGGAQGRRGRVQGRVRDAPRCIAGTATTSPAAGLIQCLPGFKYPCRASLIGSNPIF